MVEGLWFSLKPGAGREGDEMINVETTGGSFDGFNEKYDV